MIETERLALSAWTEADRAFLAMCADAEVMHDYGGPWEATQANTRSLAVMARLRLTRDPTRDFIYETGNPAVVFVAERARYAASAEGAT